MKALNVFLYEWKHFSRNPFKIVALVLFVVAALYGLHNGATLYQVQIEEIGKIKEQAETDRQKYIAYYDKGQKGPEDRPWIDLSTPFWAIWYNGIYYFKTPSPALVYNIGQAEQYGYYKRVTFLANPYDPDMTNEIANPERLQVGTLDFSFALLYLLPLLLLILLYNLKSAEAEQCFLPIIEVQVGSQKVWLLSRVTFYLVLIFVVIVSLLVYGGILTNVFTLIPVAFGQMLFYSLIYLLFWSMLYFFILWRGKRIIDTTLQMAGLWMILAFVIPAVVHQWISIEKPVNLMTEYIAATRDDRQQLYRLPDSVIQARLFAMFPEIEGTPVDEDSARRIIARNQSTTALVNEMMKRSITSIENENRSKNKLIQSFLWVNPIPSFQNSLNKISKSHFDDYQQYRDEIQKVIDKQIRVLVLDTWNDTKVDKIKYLEYNKELAIDE